MTKALITPEIVEWARERQNLTIDEVARKVQVKAQRVEAWETGEASPTFRQAQRLAERLYVPFGYLFLSSPPTLNLPLPDLRTVSGEPRESPSPDFLDLISDVIAKQEWCREYLESEDAQPIPFIGTFSRDDDADDIARDIRSYLSINARMRLTARNWEEFLRDFIRRAEDVGVLVMRSGIVGSNTHRHLSVEEFRGFAISDDIAPLVFINGQDAKNAQIFTLAHELAHLWIGESGVSNPNYQEQSFRQINDIERLCNRVAAEVLLPKVDFQLRWQDGLPTERNIQEIARRYRVSRITVLRQAFDQGKIDSETYWEFFQSEIGRYKKGRADGGGDFYNNLTARNSATLTLALIGATLERRVSHRDAANLLNIRVGTLDSVVDKFFGTHD
jgi:Zn-dependent peptidase ImmA (M78 family)/DNA-binding XRE family transcriptional regulator